MTRVILFAVLMSLATFGLPHDTKAEVNVEQVTIDPCPPPPHVYYWDEEGKQLLQEDLDRYEWIVTTSVYLIDPHLGNNFEVWDLTVKPIGDVPGEAIIDWPTMGGEDGNFYSIPALEELGAGSYLPQQ